MQINIGPSSAPKFPEEVVQNYDDVCTVGKEQITALKSKALSNRRKRVRMNLHHSSDDKVHEMLIVHCQGNYVRPHRHIDKSESFHVIEGRLEVLIFNDEGQVIKRIIMGDFSSGYPFCYRVSENIWHSVNPLTPTVVFHEVTKGPFVRGDSEQALWAPSEDENMSVIENYKKKIGID